MTARPDPVIITDPIESGVVTIYPPISEDRENRIHTFVSPQNGKNSRRFKKSGMRGGEIHNYFQTSKKIPRILINTNTFVEPPSSGEQISSSKDNEQEDDDEIEYLGEFRTQKETQTTQTVSTSAPAEPELIDISSDDEDSGHVSDTGSTSMLHTATSELVQAVSIHHEVLGNNTNNSTVRMAEDEPSTASNDGGNLPTIPEETPTQSSSNNVHLNPTVENGVLPRNASPTPLQDLSNISLSRNNAFSSSYTTTRIPIRSPIKSTPTCHYLLDLPALRHFDCSPTKRNNTSKNGLNGPSAVPADSNSDPSSQSTDVASEVEGNRKRQLTDTDDVLSQSISPNSKRVRLNSSESNPQNLTLNNEAENFLLGLSPVSEEDLEETEDVATPIITEDEEAILLGSSGSEQEQGNPPTVSVGDAETGNGDATPIMDPEGDNSSTTPFPGKSTFGFQNAQNCVNFYDEDKTQPSFPTTEENDSQDVGPTSFIGVLASTSPVKNSLPEVNLPQVSNGQWVIGYEIPKSTDKADDKAPIRVITSFPSLPGSQNEQDERILRASPTPSEFEVGSVYMRGGVHQSSQGSQDLDDDVMDDENNSERIEPSQTGRKHKNRISIPVTPPSSQIVGEIASPERKCDVSKRNQNNSKRRHSRSSISSASEVGAADDCLEVESQPQDKTQACNDHIITLVDRYLEKRNWKKVFEQLGKLLRPEAKYFPKASILCEIVCSCILQISGFRINRDAPRLALSYLNALVKEKPVSEHIDNYVSMLSYIGESIRADMGAVDKVKKVNPLWLCLSKILDCMKIAANAKLPKSNKYAMELFELITQIVTKEYELDNPPSTESKKERRKVTVKPRLIALFFERPGSIGLPRSDDYSCITHELEFLDKIFQFKEFREECELAMSWISMLVFHWEQFFWLHVKTNLLSQAFVDKIKNLKRESKKFSLDNYVFPIMSLIKHKVLGERICRTFLTERLNIKMRFDERPGKEAIFDYLEYLTTWSATKDLIDPTDMFPLEAPNSQPNSDYRKGAEFRSKSNRSQDKDNKHNVLNRKGETDLHLFCKKSEQDENNSAAFQEFAARLKESHKAHKNVCPQDYFNNTPLHDAMYSGNTAAVVEYLDYRNKNCDLKDSPWTPNYFLQNQDGNTPFHSAAASLADNDLVIACIRGGLATLCCETHTEQCLQIKNKQGLLAFELTMDSERVKLLCPKNYQHLEEFLVCDNMYIPNGEVLKELEIKKMIAFWAYFRSMPSCISITELAVR